MVNTAETGGSAVTVSDVPKLPPKLKKNANISRPKVAPPSPPSQSQEFSIYDTPPPFKAPPPPIVTNSLALPSRKDDNGRLSDGEDYLPLDDQNNSNEAIYTPLAGKEDDNSDCDDYDDVEYINVKYIRPPPSKKELDAIAKSSESERFSQTENQKQNTCQEEIDLLENKENTSGNQNGNNHQNGNSSPNEIHQNGNSSPNEEIHQNSNSCPNKEIHQNGNSSPDEIDQNGVSSSHEDFHQNGHPLQCTEPTSFEGDTGLKTTTNGHSELTRKSSYTKPQTCLASRIHQFENF